MDRYTRDQINHVFELAEKIVDVIYFHYLPYFTEVQQLSPL